MKKSNSLSRAHLEMLSSQELIHLADEYGIDIPDDLNRQFIIGDLLELAEELEEGEQQKETIVLSDEDGEDMNVNTLPEGYNETKISVLLRNPVSLFVWWDLNENDARKINEFYGTLRLAVYFFETATDEKPCDTFSIQISFEAREQYVIIPAGKKVVRVDLIGEYDSKTECLAYSPKIPLPTVSDVMALKPGEKLGISRILQLSDAAELLREHYNEYRQSFY